MGFGQRISTMRRMRISSIVDVTLLRRLFPG
jgi:hypothetical protein